MTPQKSVTAAPGAIPGSLQHASGPTRDGQPQPLLDVSEFRHLLSDAELEVHIFDCERLWRAAYQRFQDFGNPHDRDEALLHLHRMNEAILSRSAASQAQAHAEFERRLDEGVDYFQVQGARLREEMLRGAA